MGSTRKPIVMREKRQITLPVHVCEELQLTAGQAFDYQYDRTTGRIVLQPAELRRRDEPPARKPARPRPTKAQLEARRRLAPTPMTEVDLEELDREAVTVRGKVLTGAALDAAIREGRDE